MRDSSASVICIASTWISSSFGTYTVVVTKVVFIPSLEENVFPTQRMQQAPGLIAERARLLYVSITRARAAVVLSATYARNQNGQHVQNNVSRFAVQLGLQIAYQGQPQGMTPQQAQQIVATCAQL